MPEATCPGCGGKIDGATSLRGKRAPKAGDLTVCFYCAALLQFHAAFGLVKLRALPSDVDAATRLLVGRVQETVLARLGKTSS
jgi:hypothetical protein